MHPDTLKRLVRERFFSPRIWSVSVTGDFQGSTPAEVIDETAIPRLIEHLLDPSRTRPVVAVTTRHREPLVDVKALVEAVARDLVSLGYAPDRVRTERFGPTG